LLQAEVPFRQEDSMRMIRSVVATLLIAVFAIAVPASAEQRHAVAPEAIAQVVAQRVAQQDTDRAAIREALSRLEVKDVAAATGIDLARVAAAVETMDAAQLAQAASHAQEVNSSLVGGASTITISTTTIIIVLLVVILILVVD
jgi:hypothetical protein